MVGLIKHGGLVGMISGLIIWAVHFVIVYAFAGVGCASGWDNVEYLGINAMSFALAVITGVALVLILLTGLRGLQGWRLARASPNGASKDIAERYRFVGLLRLIVAGLALVAVLFTGIPIPLLPPCD